MKVQKRELVAIALLLALAVWLFSPGVRNVIAQVADPALRALEYGKFDADGFVQQNLSQVIPGRGMGGAYADNIVITVTNVSAASAQLAANSWYRASCTEGVWWLQGAAVPTAVHHVDSGYLAPGASLYFYTATAGGTAMRYIAFVRDTDDGYCSLDLEN